MFLACTYSQEAIIVVDCFIISCIIDPLKGRDPTEPSRCLEGCQMMLELWHNVEKHSTTNILNSETQTWVSKDFSLSVHRPDFPYFHHAGWFEGLCNPTAGFQGFRSGFKGCCNLPTKYTYDVRPTGGFTCCSWKFHINFLEIQHNLGVKASNPTVLLANLANSTERFIAATASTSGPNKLGMGPSPQNLCLKILQERHMPFNLWVPGSEIVI